MTREANNGNQPSAKIVSAPVRRVRASGPILILAVLFIVASFLTWYFTWFGRGLNDSEIAKYLVDEKHPRHVQHALLQIQQRIEAGDQSARQWYPQIISLASNPEPEFRLTVAWLMGADNSAEEFHVALKKLLNDTEPIVRRNAALALVRFGDPVGRPELVSILEPYGINAPTKGTIVSTVPRGTAITRGGVLARIGTPNNEIATVRSPLNGKVDQVFVSSEQSIETGAALMTLAPDEQSLWESLRSLAVIGQKEDVPSIKRYANAGSGTSERIRQQAALTIEAIQKRQP
jgi:biotin carboxyl carrier protein